jgi:hypothetical protein
LSHYSKYAKETGRVGVTVSGSATGVNPTSYSQNGAGPKIAAFVTLADSFYAGPVETRVKAWKDLGALDMSKITAISLVMYTPTTSTGGSGVNMQTVKIELPAGFTISGVEAIRSSSSVKAENISGEVILSSGRNAVFVTLPASNMVSIRLTK